MTTYALFDRCRHRPHTYAENWWEHRDHKLVRCTMLYCDDCVPQRVVDYARSKLRPADPATGQDPGYEGVALRSEDVP